MKKEVIKQIIHEIINKANNYKEMKPNKDILEETVKEITDYGFNDEYGYYNDWADGVRPIIQKAIKETREEVCKELIPEEDLFDNRLEKDKAYSPSDLGEIIARAGQKVGHNNLRQEIINKAKEIK